jgi:hypothetical protein
MKTSDNVDKIFPAFVAFQAEMPPVPKDSINPHFRNKYASLGAITEATRPVLAKHGLAYTQGMAIVDGVQVMFTRIIHQSGQWMEDGGYALNPSKNDPQGMGSAVTYARRYTIGSTLGIITEDDDDGNRASEPAPVKKLPPVPKAEPAPLQEPDWFNDLGELNDKGKLAAKSIHEGFAWEKIEKHYLIDKHTRKLVQDYIETIK